MTIWLHRAMMTRLASLAATLCALAGCASEPPSPGYYGAIFSEHPKPGAPRTPLQIYQRLSEDGYALFAAPQQQGAVYFVGAYDRRGRPHCVIVEAFNGVILQAFAYRGDKILLVNRHTPGPGFPGYPHFPDGRFAAGFCPPPPTI